MGLAATGKERVGEEWQLTVSRVTPDYKPPSGLSNTRSTAWHGTAWGPRHGKA